MKINRLGEEVSSRIAAGEVIERPASVAKELIENSIDAGAGTVTIHTEQGGKASFVIEDDGIGIAFEELPLALERYATSKISGIEDLERISTLGYRGEALASIAAVSRMEIRSREREAAAGGVIRCEGGEVTLHTHINCLEGTRIEVDDLFFNLPARRKFLKTASAEIRRIIQTVNDYALINYGMTFCVYSDGKKILEHLPVDSIDAAVAKRWGHDVKIYTVRSATSQTIAELRWNPMPDSRRVVTIVFVNGRHVQDATVRAAICSGEGAAYGEWFVNITVPPEDVDVNIHPTKEEVHFRRSQDVFRTIYHAVSDILSKRFLTGGMSGNTDEAIGSETQNVFTRDYIDTSDLLYSQKPWHPVIQPDSTQKGEWAYTPRFASKEQGGNSECAPNSRVARGPLPENLAYPKRYIGQSASGFLLFDFEGALAIVDPHAAHERILFEKIVREFKNEIPIQYLTLPEPIPDAVAPEAELYKETLERLGFSVKDGKLTGVPAIRGKGHMLPIAMLRSALRGIETESDATKRDREVWWRLARLACRDAVKLGAAFTPEEATELMKCLDNCETPFTCPHGRPTMFLVENKKLEELFER